MKTLVRAAAGISLLGLAWATTRAQPPAPSPSPHPTAPNAVAEPARQGYRQLQIWVPEDLHKKLMAQRDAAKRMPRRPPGRDITPRGPGRCGMMMIVSPYDGEVTATCSAKCEPGSARRCRAWSSPVETSPFEEGPVSLETWCECSGGD